MIFTANGDQRVLRYKGNQKSPLKIQIIAMAQILDPLPDNQKDNILCCYVNATNQIQVVRITNVVNWYFERVVFPGQRLVFEALRDAVLEVHTGMMASAILSDTIPAERLVIGDSEEKEELAVPDSAEKPTSLRVYSDRLAEKNTADLLYFHAPLVSAN
jgi:hypothetical protein